MRTGSETEFGRVERGHWESFAARCGLPKDLVLDWVRTDAGRIQDAMADAVATIPARTRERAVLTNYLLPRVVELARLTIAGIDRTSSFSRPSGNPGAAIARAASTAHVPEGSADLPLLPSRQPQGREDENSGGRADQTVDPDGEPAAGKQPG